MPNPDLRPVHGAHVDEERLGGRADAAPGLGLGLGLGLGPGLGLGLGLG